MENQFYKIMKSHSDEELIEVYKNQLEYTSEAIEAMELVLLERNLIENATQALGVKKEEEALSKEELYNKFQRSEFGKIISDIDFANESLSDSIYLKRYISPLHNYNWLNQLFIILGIMGAILSIIIIGIGKFHSPFNIMLILSLISALLLPLGIWKLSKNKAQISIVKEKNGNILRIKGTKDYYEIPIPFRYECYWSWHYIKLNLKQVKLSILLFDDKNNIVIELRELIELLKTPPPNWDEFPKDLKLKDKSLFVFTNYGTQKPFLYKLQKILNGLHE